MPNALKVLWRWGSKIVEVRDLLDKFGLLKIMLSIIVAVAIFIGSHLKSLAWPETFTLALVVFAVVLELSVRLTEIIRRTVKVKLIPAMGPFPVQLLKVTNLGAPQTLRADCALLQRRNDNRNQLHRSTFRMEWDYQDVRTSARLSRGGSRNLVVATAGETRGVDQGHPYEMEWIAVTGLSANGQREEKQRSTWNRGDSLPEYDLEITITGKNQKPHIEYFTLKAGHATALEMFTIGRPVTASTHVVAA